MMAEELSEGLVIRIKGPDYIVYDRGGEVRCSVRGKFRIGRGDEEVLPVVGDTVEYRRGSGLITAVRPRTSVFARAETGGRKGFRILGSNLDHVFLVHSIKEPDLNLRLLDRMLTAAERDAIEPVIVINKIDLLLGAGELDRALEPYLAMRYRIVRASALTGEGTEELARIMDCRVTMMAGPSGAGKTSLISRIEPGIEARISDVSSSTGKGRHTTTHFELHRLSSGGWLGDSPGIREFGIWGLDREDLGDHFRDFDRFLGLCRFNRCTHSHEPDCAVKEAVGRGEISQARYSSYLRILESLEQA